MIKKIEIDGLLSFDKFELELRNLNVLIGPNGSGKSNLIEVLSLLQALPTDVGEPIRRGGGIGEWLRKAGSLAKNGSVVVLTAGRDEHEPLLYSLCLEKYAEKYRIAEERLRATGQEEADTELFGTKDGVGFVTARMDTAYADGSGGSSVQRRRISSEGQSVLREIRDPHAFSEVSGLAEQFDRISLYRDWSFGREAQPRLWQSTDLPSERLVTDASNLALVINDLIHSGMSANIEEEFRKFLPRFRRFGISVHGGQAILTIVEEGVSLPIPATRWSDGMIRYLCLLAILCHPNPPPLICIDEPELGFHPDIMPSLGRLIKEASERTQIIITTHSKQLVDEFGDDPGAVVVCERDFEGATRMERLDSEKLSEWLERYTLGELWEKGEIGGDLF